MGTAFVEMAVETEGFEDDFERAVDRAVKEASKSKHFDPMVKAAGDAGERASAEFGRRFTLDARGRLHDERGRFVASFTSAFAPIGFRVGVGFFSRFIAGFAQAAKGAPILGTLLSSFSQVSTLFGAMGIPGVLGSLAAILPLIGVLIIVVPLLTSAIFALGGALLSLLGVVGPIPALLAGLLATVIPLVIAFQGFGEVIAAIASGDLEKINEAMQKLTPSARAVAKELQTLMPFFSQLRKDVQETFFSRLAGGLTKIVNALGPAASGGLQNVAFALGTLLNSIVAFASSPVVVDFVARLLAGVTEGISSSGPTVISFLNTLVMLANAALPIVGELMGEIGGSVRAFSEWATGAVKDGSFQTWVREAFETLGLVLNVGKEFFLLLVDMFALTDDSGQTFLEDVALAIKQLREFFQSPEGKEFIENMIVLAEDFGDILIWVVGIVATLIGLFASAIEMADDLGEALERLAKRKDFLGFLARTFTPIGILGFAAEGGVYDHPVIAGEAGPEAILPLSDPVRAREVLADPQVMAALGSGEGGTTVWAIFDGEPFQARITRTVRGETSTVARDLSQQPRAGV